MNIFLGILLLAVWVAFTIGSLNAIFILDEEYGLKERPILLRLLLVCAFVIPFILYPLMALGMMLSLVPDVLREVRDRFFE